MLMLMLMLGSTEFIVVHFAGCVKGGEWHFGDVTLLITN